MFDGWLAVGAWAFLVWSFTDTLRNRQRQRGIRPSERVVRNIEWWGKRVISHFPYFVGTLACVFISVLVVMSGFEGMDIASGLAIALTLFAMGLVNWLTFWELD